jgi:hypothetical protein
VTARATTFATNDVLTANDLNALAGAWNSYTPTLGVFTPGNGTSTGEYLQFGKLVHFRAQFVFGTTSAAATGAPTLSLPVTAKASLGLLYARFVDTGTTAYAAFGAMTTSAVTMYIVGTNGLNVASTTTLPFTWATGDGLYVAGTYEAA